MRATIGLAVLLTALVLCGGCFGWRAPVVPPVGLIYTHYRAPLTADATDFTISGRGGMAHTMTVREPLLTGQGVAWAEAAVREAAQEGGLHSVDYADYEVYSILGVYSRFTVRVYGR